MTTDGEMNFFAIALDAGALVVRRVPLLRAVQLDLTAEFAAQIAAFKSEETELIPFDPGYRPEEGELFQVPGYTLPSHVAGILTAPERPEPLTVEEIEHAHTRAIVAREGNALYFQTVRASQIIRRSKFNLFFSGTRFRRIEHSALQVKPSLDAIIDTDGSLYFRSAHNIVAYLSIDSLFVEATNDSVNELLTAECLDCSDNDAILQLLDKPSRRKVSAIQARGILANLSASQIVTAGAKYGLSLEKSGRGAAAKVVVPRTKKDLKAFLRLLNEDFLDSSLSGDAYQVNSKRKIG